MIKTERNSGQPCRDDAPRETGCDALVEDQESRNLYRHLVNSRSGWIRLWRSSRHVLCVTQLLEEYSRSLFLTLFFATIDPVAKVGQVMFVANLQLVLDRDPALKGKSKYPIRFNAILPGAVWQYLGAACRLLAAVPTPARFILSNLTVSH